MNDRPDAALVEETLAGDLDAFAELVRRYEDHVYGLAAGRVCVPELGRDVAEETFICAHRDLATLQKPSRFGGWVRGIVRNLSLQTSREVQRVCALADGLDVGEDLIAEFRSTAMPRAEVEVRAAVRGALESLNDRNREVVGLHYMSNLSPDEIGDFVGASGRSIRKRLERVREELEDAVPLVALAFEASALPEDFAETVAGLIEAEDASRDAAGDRRDRPAGPLGEALGDPQELVRRVSAHALRLTGDIRVLRPVLRLLHAPDAPDGRRADLALAVPGVREALLETLGDGRKVDRIYAMAALWRLGDDEEVQEAVARAFRRPDGNGRVARLALFVLCDMRPDDAPALVSEGLRSASGQVRSGAAWEAVSRGLLPHIDECVALMGEGTPWQGRRCAGQLLLRHDGEGRSALEDLMESGEPPERLAAATALAVSGSDAAFDVLKRGLLGGKSERGWRRALTRAAGGEYPEELGSWIDEEGKAINELPVALWTLARGAAPEPTPIIEALVAGGQPAARAAALRILAAHKGVEAVPVLRSCLREGRPRKVAQEAFRQFLRLGEDAAPHVREMLGSEHWTERKAAVGLLRRWDMLTGEQLAAAQEDPHVAVRHAAGLRPPAQET
jgi:RNA polymerase sigma-70 factor (ECF subfamily)